MWTDLAARRGIAYNCQTDCDGAKPSAQNGLGPIEEMSMVVMFCRCNAILSLALNEAGEGCRYVAKSDTEEGAVADMKNHLYTIHEVDAKELEWNIKGAMKATRR